jgi:hypothetical protein
MSVETFQPIPIEVFGTWTTLLDPSDVPPGMSPDLRNVEFFPGGVRTRPGLLAAYTPLGGAPKVNGLKSYITKNLVQRLLVFDSLGNLYKESASGTLSLVASEQAQSCYTASTTLFGREYTGISDGFVGQDLPRQFDDTNFDRVSQVGPGEGPAGAHQCSVIFVTRQGYWTAPSPPVSWTAAGGKKVNVTNIPVGPANIIQRLLAFTAAGGASFFSCASYDGDQRQCHHIGRSGLHGSNPALRHERGRSLPPDRAAEPAQRDRLRLAPLLVGRARQDVELAQPHV